MNDIVYFLRKGLDQTKDINSFIYLLYGIKDKLNNEQRETIALSIFTNTEIHNVNGSIDDFFEKIKAIISENLLIKEKVRKYLLNDYLKKYMIFFEEQSKKDKADQFLSLYLNILSKEDVLSIFSNKEILYKLIEANFTLSLEVFIKQGLYLFEDEDNINAINHSEWLIYIKKNNKDFVSAKSNDKKYEKAWQKLYFKNKREQLNEFIINNINAEEIKEIIIKKHFIELNEFLIKPAVDNVMEEFLFSNQDSYNFKDEKGRSSLFLTVYHNKNIIKKVYRKTHIKHLLKETDNKGRNILPYCFFNNNELENLIKTVLRDIKPDLDNNGKGLIEQFIDLKRDTKNNVFYLYPEILKACEDDTLIGDQESLMMKLMQLSKGNRSDLSNLLPFFRSIQNIQKYNPLMKSLWLIAQIEEDSYIFDEKELEKLLNKGFIINKEILEVDIFDLIKNKVWSEEFKDKIIVSHNENVLMNSVMINKMDKCNKNIILNRI